MSKESKNKKKQSIQAQTEVAPSNEGVKTKRYLTDEEKAYIIKQRLANRPVIVWRYRNGRWNRRLIFMLAAMVVALAAGLLLLTRY